jgi:hypothetical protein
MKFALVGLKRRWLVAGAMVVLVSSAYLAYSLTRPPDDQFAAGGMMCHSGKCCKVCPADFAKGDGRVEGRPVLNPLMFVGSARQAYIVAKQNPWLLAQLWCWCGCDRTSGHRSLLDCYRDYHGATCAICTGEALEANQLFNQGSPVEQIREALRTRFARRD